MADPFPKTDPSTSETGCCPRFQPEMWDGKTFQMDDVLFARASARSLMYVPLNMDRVMTRSMQKIQSAEAAISDDYLILSQDKSPWRCDHYFRVSREVPGMDMVRMTGTFLARVYEGPFSQMGSWMKDFTAWVQEQGHAGKAVFTFYTTCPKCAKTYGKNYVVLLARLT